MKLLLCLLLSVAFAKSHHRKSTAPAKAFPSKVHLTKVGSCDAPEATKKVMILKQWHLAPTTTTKSFKEKYPQEKNQTAIYQVLAEGASRGELQLVVSEGCEGEITPEFKTQFNGWDFESLSKQSSQKGYDKIITLAPLKAKAKFRDKIPTFCGDDAKLIQEGNLHLSNLRGWFGFYVRLNESKGDTDKMKLYAESAADLLKVPKDTAHDKLILQIKERIKLELGDFAKSLNERDDSFVKTLQAHEFTRAAIVIGGLHAADLKEKIQKAGMGCDVYEPPGYQAEDEKLIKDFEHAMN